MSQTKSAIRFLLMFFAALFLVGVALVPSAPAFDCSDDCNNEYMDCLDNCTACPCACWSCQCYSGCFKEYPACDSCD